MFKSASVNTASPKSNSSSLFQSDKSEDAFVQPKLTVGKPNDKYEVEADRMADKVVAKGKDTANSFFSPSPKIQKQQEETVNAYTVDNKVDKKPEVSTTNSEIQKQEEEVQEKEEGEEAVQEKSFLQRSEELSFSNSPYA